MSHQILLQCILSKNYSLHLQNLNSTKLTISSKSSELASDRFNHGGKIQCDEGAEQGGGKPFEDKGDPHKPHTAFQLD